MFTDFNCRNCPQIENLNFRLKTINYQLSTTNYQLPTISL